MLHFLGRKKEYYSDSDELEGCRMHGFVTVEHGREMI
jgi:hypothetical protein